MIIRKTDEVEFVELNEEGNRGVSIKTFSESSNRFSMIYFYIHSKGHTSYSSIKEESWIFVLKGKGVIRGENALYTVEPGSLIYIASGEKHSFENPFDEPFEFICFKTGNPQTLML
ncbi:MAG: cupin domain-containing protein [Synergistetes bacterium]|nr:cupin domain-containing protein [Synergistota bacterium]MDK2871134.1 hypothetical protein [bacterium]